MLAVRLHEGDSALHFDDIEIPVADGPDQVVVKVLAPELAQGLSVERFHREIRTAAALQQGRQP